jgi:hypothetical protein
MLKYKLLKDIIDLDYLLSLDDQRDCVQEKEKTLTRDREIFNLDHRNMDDTALLFSWLEYRRMIFFQGAGKNTGLPGAAFTSLFRWIARLLILTGFLSGLGLAYSFLAYHGTRPVNVSIFFAVFIVSQVLLFLFILFMLVKRFYMKTTEGGYDQSILHTLFFGLFFRALPQLKKRLGKRMGGEKMDAVEFTAALIRMKSREYRSVFFWPFFSLSSFFAVSFSLGALGGTLFRVAVSDLAFGWQSTLMAASSSIHKGVTMICLPWSWFVPENIAHPSLEQIEGSRILLKEGIATLATKDLVSWWPFLCLGILFYAVLPRFMLILLGVLAQKRAIAQFNFERPRFKKLLVRMQSPRMDIRFDEERVWAVRQNPVPNSLEPDPLESDPLESDATGPDLFMSDVSMPGVSGPEGAKANLSKGVLVLAPGSVYPTGKLGGVAGFIKEQLFLDIGSSLFLSFDYGEDEEQLLALAPGTEENILLLQEVWQPPIRGLLHYFVQLKTQAFKDRALLILLTQTPGEETQVVDREDINFRVWEKAILQLGHPDIMLERVYK